MDLAFVMRDACRRSAKYFTRKAVMTPSTATDLDHGSLGDYSSLFVDPTDARNFFHTRSTQLPPVLRGTRA